MTGFRIALERQAGRSIGLQHYSSKGKDVENIAVRQATPCIISQPKYLLSG